MSATPSRLVNYKIPVPGTSVVACLGHRPELDPGRWFYTLWEGEGDDENMLAYGEMDIPQPDTYVITAEQVARIAFLLECEYATPQPPYASNP